MPPDDEVAEPSTGGAACSVDETTPSVSRRPGYVEPVMTRSRAHLASVATVMEMVRPASGVGEQSEVPGIAVDECLAEAVPYTHRTLPTNRERETSVADGSVAHDS